jgi:molybdate transport system substrate-binding protein
MVCNTGGSVKKALCVVVFLLGLLVPAFAQQPRLIVSAAASLTEVLTALKPAAETFIGARVLFNFGGSGALRRQVEEGAPVDVFFSAAAEDMDRLEAQGLIVASSRRDILSNAMVLIGDAGTPLNDAGQLRSLFADAEFLAVGNPDSVPAGRYAVQALMTYGLYSVVEKKLVLGGTVREVLQFVESGSAPLGIVFVTDALSVKQMPRGTVAAGSPVRQLYLFPDSALKTPIRYPAAVVGASKNRETAEKLIRFYRSAAARETFRKAGFTVRSE